MGAKLIIRKGPRGMSKAFNEAREKANAAIGRMWHSEMLKDHFTERASMRYGYSVRTKRYEARKTKKMGHKKPLVWSGTLQKTVAGAVRIRATPKSVKVTMSGPKWLKGFASFFKNRRGPNMAAEITKIAKSEGKRLAEVAAKILKEAMDAAKG
ncbi:MAG: hypothetical protein SGI88_07765 [Candidatus Hydrogenedentes bacterium]|nr:hypothetical protein [Candidatus Hydrogenedentota bacterium]